MIDLFNERFDIDGIFVFVDVFVVGVCWVVICCGWFIFGDLIMVICYDGNFVCGNNLFIMVLDLYLDLMVDKVVEKFLDMMVG